MTTEAIDPVVIKIIKLHGSLNWKYCNCCNDVLLTSRSETVLLGEGDPPWALGPVERRSPPDVTSRCSRDGTPHRTLLVPPSHLKELGHPISARLFLEAADELRRARRVVFVGYSLREADVHIAAILKKSLRPDADVVVVDVDGDEDFRLRWRRLSPRLRFVTRSFEDLVGDAPAMEELLTLPGRPGEEA